MSKIYKKCNKKNKKFKLLYNKNKNLWKNINKRLTKNNSLKMLMRIKVLKMLVNKVIGM